MLVLGREPAHRREAREDQRDDARLGAAREHRVGVAALDHLRRLADRVRAGRARRDDGVVRALDPERDRELARDACRRARSAGSSARRGRGRARGACRPARRCPGTPPIAEPKTIPTRVGSKPFEARVRRAPRGPRRRRTARCARASAPPSAETTWLGSKPFTSAAIRTGSPSVSNVEIQSIPLSPASAARQVDGASSPSGVTAPIPVTATRFIEREPYVTFARSTTGRSCDRRSRVRGSRLHRDAATAERQHRGLVAAGVAAASQLRDVRVLRGRAPSSGRLFGLGGVLGIA